tara:strand:- start:697 stop:978 length:282 start_codon:yes stop_codon:yes gene_type:complete
MVIEKWFIRTLQTLFVVVVALVISVQHQRIKSCEDDIKTIQRLQYLQWKIKMYEDLKSNPPPPLQDKDLLPIPKFTPPKNSDRSYAKKTLKES